MAGRAGRSGGDPVGRSAPRRPASDAATRAARGGCGAPTHQQLLRLVVGHHLLLLPPAGAAAGALLLPRLRLAAAVGRAAAADSRPIRLLLFGGVGRARGDVHWLGHMQLQQAGRLLYLQSNRSLGPDQIVFPRLPPHTHTHARAQPRRTGAAA